LQDRIALSVFFFGLKGLAWKRNEGWMNTTLHHCDWFGISCEDELVTGISLSNNRLAILEDTSIQRGDKPLPSEVGLLRNLKTLDISGNFITGSLPSEIGHLTDLEDFNIRGCKEIISLPDTLGELKNLGKECPN
jgi:hypothetical protein